MYDRGTTLVHKRYKKNGFPGARKMLYLENQSI
jgi:hypothetical protein